MKSIFYWRIESLDVVFKPRKKAIYYAPKMLHPEDFTFNFFFSVNDIRDFNLGFSTPYDDFLYLDFEVEILDENFRKILNQTFSSISDKNQNELIYNITSMLNLTIYSEIILKIFFSINTKDNISNETLKSHYFKTTCAKILDNKLAFFTFKEDYFYTGFISRDIGFEDLKISFSHGLDWEVYSEVLYKMEIFLSYGALKPGEYLQIKLCGEYFENGKSRLFTTKI